MIISITMVTTPQSCTYTILPSKWYIYDRKQNIMSNMISFNRFILWFACPNSRLVRSFRANTVTPATLVSVRTFLRRTWCLIQPAINYYTIYLSFWGTYDVCLHLYSIIWLFLWYASRILGHTSYYSTSTYTGCT